MIKSRTTLKEFLIVCQLVLLQISGTVSLWGGQPEDIKNAPFAAQIYVEGEFKCGATLVSNCAVVTAASCVYDVFPEQLTVKFGTSHFLDAAAVSSSVIDIIKHPHFNNNTYNMDVAVLKLQDTINSDLAQPIELCKNGWRGGAEAKVYGWGSDKFDTDPSKLQSASFEVVKQAQCKDSYSYTMSITNSMFCADAEGKSSCFGDAGGPVVINKQFCGISTGLLGCSHPNVPHVFTNVLRVRKFITAAMKFKSKRS